MAQGEAADFTLAKKRNYNNKSSMPQRNTAECVSVCVCVEAAGETNENHDHLARTERFLTAAIIALLTSQRDPAL